MVSWLFPFYFFFLFLFANLTNNLTTSWEILMALNGVADPQTNLKAQLPLVVVVGSRSFSDRKKWGISGDCKGSLWVLFLTTSNLVIVRMSGQKKTTVHGSLFL